MRLTTVKVRRRGVLAAGLAGALARPGLAAAQGARVLRFVPSVEIGMLDPILTTSTPTRNHAYLVFDTLYGLDSNFQPHPQMLEGHVVDPDFRNWTLRLREGLKFHDGEPVRGADVVASLRRWGQRDPLGRQLFALTDELTAPSDRDIRFRLKRRFPFLPAALGKTSPLMPAIMPERLAATDPMKPVAEMIGSGPYRFLADERVAGSLTAYARFDGYVPRADGPVAFTAGPKVAHFDRIEWRVIPDASTAAAALQSGEIDWWERPIPDAVPLLRRRRISVGVIEKLGLMGVLRPNSLQPPFDNPEIRRVVLSCIDQADFMTAAAGTDTTLWRTGVGVFPPETPMATDVGNGVLKARKDFEGVKRDLAAAGYRGEPVVLLTTSDPIPETPMGEVAADLFRRIGFNVEVRQSDWATLAQRRGNRGPTTAGGWSGFITAAGAENFIDPSVSVLTRGNGAEGWFGWPDIPELEQLNRQWMEAPDQATRQDIARTIQTVVWREVPYFPLGQFFLPTAWRDLEGLRDGFPQFYSVRRA